MSVFDSKHNEPILTSNAAMFRRGAKVSFVQMLSLIVGFASGASIGETAATTGLHRDTVRDIFGALRDRLEKPRFRKWVQSAYASPHLNDEDDSAQMDEAREALFHCHENAGCQKRFSAGRRKARVCRTCPLSAYVQSHDAEPEYTEALVDLVDSIRRLYQLFGWKESVNSGADKRAIFEKRFRHFEVYSTAVGHTRFDDHGKVISDEDDFLSIPHLAKELTDDLKEEPLK